MMQICPTSAWEPWIVSWYVPLYVFPNVSLLMDALHCLLILMSVSYTKISIAAYKYVNILMRCSSPHLRNDFLFIQHLKKPQTWCTMDVIERSANIKKLGDIAGNRQKKTLFITRPNFPRSVAAHPLHFTHNVTLLFVKNTEICILCLTELPYLSAESHLQHCSVKQMEPSHHTVCLCHPLSRSHKLGEDADAKWHHYSSKHLPSFDFSCVSDRLFKSVLWSKILEVGWSVTIK